MFTSRKSVGLDVGSQSIKLVGMRRHGDTGTLKTFGQIATPPGMVENGLINNPEEVGQELGKLVGQLRLKGSRVISALSGQQVYTRLMTLPAMPHGDMRTAALYQATSFLPINIDDVTADIYPVREFEDQEGKMVEVFFVAARKSQAENLVKTCQIAGLKLTRLEIEPLALKTLYQPQISKDKVYGIINIGAQRSYLSIFQDNNPVFLRSIAFGCLAFYLQIPRIAENECRLEDLNVEDPECRSLLRNLIDELVRSLDYFRLQNKDDSITNMLLCGGCARLAGIDELLSRELNLPVQRGSIEQNIKFPQTITEDQINDLRFDYPVALGLALRGGA
ncbi:MAG: type IV pilus assembly protein PilM [Syntrophomonadaceae bacterium]|mgnify:FL=1|nr:type IV pilus assembly protein PilM [Syntrophomonadaceae bacterium]